MINYFLISSFPHTHIFCNSSYCQALLAIHHIKFYFLYHALLSWGQNHEWVSPGCELPKVVDSHWDGELTTWPEISSRVSLLPQKGISCHKETFTCNSLSHELVVMAHLTVSHQWKGDGKNNNILLFSKWSSFLFPSLHFRVDSQGPSCYFTHLTVLCLQSATEPWWQKKKLPAGIIKQAVVATNNLIFPRGRPCMLFVVQSHLQGTGYLQIKGD